MCFWAYLRSSQEARGFGQVSGKDFGVNPGRAWKPPRASPLLEEHGQRWGVGGEASGSLRKSPAVEGRVVAAADTHPVPTAFLFCYSGG